MRANCTGKTAALPSLLCCVNRSLINELLLVMTLVLLLPLLLIMMMTMLVLLLLLLRILAIHSIRQPKESSTEDAEVEVRAVHATEAGVDGEADVQVGGAVIHAAGVTAGIAAGVAAGTAEAAEAEAETTEARTDIGAGAAAAEAAAEAEAETRLMDETSLARQGNRTV
jgi:hypothetical protein